MRGKADYSDQYPFGTKADHSTKETVVFNMQTGEEVERFPALDIQGPAQLINKLVAEAKAAA